MRYGLHDYLLAAFGTINIILVIMAVILLGGI